MGNLIKAEFRKTLTTKSWWGLMIPAVAFAFLFALGWGAITNDLNDFLGSSDAQELAGLLGIQLGELPVGLLALAHGINVGMVFPVIFGVFALAGEYSKKTITTTFLTAPTRVAALSAKMITYILWGAVYGVIIVAFASLATMMTVDNAGMPSAGQWFGVLGGGILATILATLFGIGVGAVWNSVTGATITLTIWMLIVENVLVFVSFGWFEIRWLGGVLPNGTLNGIVGAIGAEAFGAAGVSVPGELDENLQWLLQYSAGAPGAFSWWAAALIFFAWTMLFFVGGWASNQRRDIT
ncbi:ABC transporter permease subunit [Prauserella cavernicola]|uniref:ABC transporter permease subunit n=1 Tax=Prauserella cavernicola TaxID=2800127 RepID=A0A934V4T8_9PSEU|nr:ABC transporter permease subunit [Prauserella cavernicola]MBK1785757.1 ABC transporter permease subunit [Prauserella cavernicola]